MQRNSKKIVHKSHIPEPGVVKPPSARRYVYGSSQTRRPLPPIKEPTPAELKGYDKPLNQTHLLHPEPEQTDPIWDLFPET